MIHILPREHGEILGRLDIDLALVLSFSTASATPLCLRCWIVPLLLDHTDIASELHNTSALRHHVCDSIAFLFVLHMQMTLGTQVLIFCPARGRRLSGLGVMCVCVTVDTGSA